MANLLSTNVSGRLYVSDFSDTNSSYGAFRFYDGSTFRGGLGLDDWAHGGSAANITMYVNGDNNFFISTSGVKRAQFNSGAAIFRTYSADTNYNIRITGGDTINAYYGDNPAGMYINWNGGNVNFGTGSVNVQGRLNVSEYVYANNGNGRIYLGGNLHIDSLNGHDIYLNYYSNQPIRTYGNTVLNNYVRIEKDWGSGDYGAEQLTIRGTYPSITLRSTGNDSKWLMHHANSLQFYYGGTVDNNNWEVKIQFASDGNIWSAFYGDWLSNILASKVSTSGGQTIGGTTYFSGVESLNLYGIRGRFTNEYIHLYHKVGVGHPGGWGQGEGNTPGYGLSTYGGATIAYGNSAGMYVYGDITTNSYVLTNYGVRVGEIWGHGGLYRSSGHMMFGTEGGHWYFQSQNNTRAQISQSDGNIWMSWANDWLSNLLAAKQNASTAITTSNIGSQSVNYASSAGNADTVDGQHASYFYPAVTPDGYSTGDINGSTTQQRLWGTDSVQDLLSFNPPTRVEYTTDDVNWIETNISNNVFSGKIYGAWGGFSIQAGDNIGRWTKVRMTWENFGYRFFSHFTLAHSTNGHSFNFVFQKSDLNGENWTEQFRQNSIGSWPGYTFAKHTNVSGWWDTRDIRMVFEVNNGGASYADNSINFGHIGIMGSYGSFNRLFDWNGDKNVYFSNEVHAQKFVDSNNTGYYIDPSGMSNVSQIQINNTSSFFTGQTSQLSVENGGTFVRFAFNEMDFYDWNYGSMLSLNNGIVQTNGSFRAPIFYDSEDTNWYVDPNSTTKLKGFQTWHGGNSNFTAFNASNEINHYDSSSNPAMMYLNWNGGAVNLSNNSLVVDDGIATASSSLRAPIFYDSNDTGYYLDPNSTSVLNNLWLKNGGNNSYSPRWDLSAYVLESQHWYGHTDTQAMYLGENNTIYVRSTAIAEGSFRAPIFYDSNDTSYYLDPNGSTSLKMAGLIETTKTSGSIISTPAMTDSVGWNGDEGMYIGSNIGGTYYIYGNGRFYDNGTYRTLIHSGNIGSQTVNYASSAGNADTVDSLHASSFVRNDVSQPTVQRHFDASTVWTNDATTLFLGWYGGKVVIGNGNQANHDNAAGLGGDTVAITNTLYSFEQTYLYYDGSTKLYMGSDGTRNTGWAYHTDNGTGLHWPNNGWHFMPYSSSHFRLYSGTSTDVGLRFETAGTLRGYVYADSGNAIGFLNNSGEWSLRTDSSRNVHIYGTNLVIGEGQGYSYIEMYDSDEGSRYIHCNSNRIGFLDQSGSWGSWCYDNGAWASVQNMQAPIFYDIEDTTYYLDPNSSGTSLKINGGIISTAGNGDVLLKHENSEANAWIFRENAYNWGLFWLNAGGETGQTIGSYTTVGAELFGMNNGVSGYNPNSAWSGTDANTRAAWMLSNYSGYLWTQGTQYSATDMRAPIFYDSENTGYYLDPNSTSSLYRVNSYYLSNAGNVTDNHPYGVYFSSDFNSDYAIYRESGGWDYPYPDLRIAFHTGIKIGAHYNYGGTRFYNNSDWATEIFSVGNGDNNVRVANNLYVSGAAYLGIIYDYDDNGYYLNPNSTSRMYQINYDYLYYAPDTNYGFLGTNVYADTINSGYGSDALELVYHRGTEVRVGGSGGDKDIRAGRFVNGVDTTYYIDLDNTAASMYAAGYIKAKSTYRNNPTAGLPGQSNPVKTASGVLATYSDNGGSYPYIIIKTRIPQDWYQMGGFTIDLFGNYSNNNTKTTISLGGYWNAESNGGFLGFEYNTTNPNVRPVIEVMRDITDGMTCFVIYNQSWNYPVVVARDLFLGYNSNDIEGGLDWSIFGADDLGNYTNNETVACRTSIPADQWYGSTYVGSGSIYSPIFYDSNDTNYYCDPNGTSRLHQVNDNGGYTYSPKYFYSNKGSGATLGANSEPTLQAFCNDNGAAFMSFHRSGYYAVNLGLDPDNVIRIGGWSASANRMQLDMSGNVTFAGDVTAYSDARIKTNVQTIENALDKTLQLRGVTYNRTDSEDTSTKVGVIAQEILEVIPEVVNQDASGMYNVSYGNLTAVLIEAIKEQQKQIDELKEIINGLTK